MKKISVIVPIYNTEKYLHRCLNSIINQTYKELEIILVDDGSKDSSPQICDEFAEKDSRVKVIHKKNEGVANARNTAISMATGEYLAFVDSDDFIDKAMFERLINNAVKNDADIAICGFKITSGDECETIYIDEEHTFNSQRALEHLYIDMDFCFVTLWGKIFKRDLFNDIIIPSVVCAEDNYVLYKIFLKSKTIVYDKSEMYMYYYRTDSATKTFNESSSEDFRAFSEQMYFWEKEGRMDLHRMCFVRCFKRLIMTMGCAKGNPKIEGFNQMMKEAYEKCINEHIDKVNIGWLEKKMYLTDWCDEQKHTIPYYYIRIKDYLRNYKFMKNYSLR